MSGKPLRYSDTQMAWFWTNQHSRKPQSTNHIALLPYGDTQMAWFWTNQDARKPQSTNHIALLRYSDTQNASDRSEIESPSSWYGTPTFWLVKESTV